jgi:hypothetical protein
MKSHPFDAVSFFFGALFLLGGIPLVVSDSGFDFLGYRWVFPAFLVTIGVVVLLTSQLTEKHDREEINDGEPIR